MHTKKDIPLILLIGLLTSYLLYVLVIYLEQFPGLHGDEAWFGIRALAISEQGVSTPHGMNNYTGALYPWLISLFFEGFSANVLTLRLLGVILNSIVYISIIAFCFFKINKKAALVLLLLLLSSVFMLFKARIAWEVYAIQPLFFVIIFMILFSIYNKRDWGNKYILAFFIFNALGIYNHFIFMMVPTSLMVVVFIDSLIYSKEQQDSKFIALVFINFIMASVLFVVKLLFPESLWVAHKYISSLIFIAIPVISFIAFRYTKPLVNALLWLHTICYNVYIKKGVSIILILSLIAFLGLHEINYIGIFSGQLIFKRLFSYNLPFVFVVILYLISLFLHGLYFRKIFHLLIKSPQSETRHFSSFVLIWTLAFMLVFVPFAIKSSFRYFIMLNILMLISLVYIYIGERKNIQRLFISSIVVGAIITNYFIHSEINKIHPPMYFQVGLLQENSHGFIKLDTVVSLIKNKNIGSFRTSNYFIEQPLLFYSKINHLDPMNDNVLFIEWDSFSQTKPFLKLDINHF